MPARKKRPQPVTKPKLQPQPPAKLPKLSRREPTGDFLAVGQSDPAQPEGQHRIPIHCQPMHDRGPATRRADRSGERGWSSEAYGLESNSEILMTLGRLGKGPAANTTCFLQAVRHSPYFFGDCLCSFIRNREFVFSCLRSHLRSVTP